MSLSFTFYLVSYSWNNIGLLSPSHKVKIHPCFCQKFYIPPYPSRILQHKPHFYITKFPVTVAVTDVTNSMFLYFGSDDN